MNARIALSGLSILATLAMIGGGTYAFFSSTATNINNVFASGTLTLALSDTNETDEAEVEATFGGADMAPGVCLSPATLTLQNTGTVAANHADVSFVNTNTAFASFLRIDTLTFDGNDRLSALSASAGNGNSIKDLQDLEASGLVNQAMTDFADHTLTMQVCLDSSAGNPQQGQTNTLNLTAFLDQGTH